MRKLKTFFKRPAVQITLISVLIVAFVSGLIVLSNYLEKNPIENVLQKTTVTKEYTIEKISENVIILSQDENNLSVKNWEEGIKKITEKYQIVSMIPIATKVGLGDCTFSPTTAIIMVIEPIKPK